MNVDEGQLDRETAERMLDGAFATREAGTVAELLLRAAAPGRPHELAREEEVVLAFRSARRRERRFSWRRLFTFKFFGAFVAVLTAGGLAFASSTGIIPVPFRADPPSAPSTTGPDGVDDPARVRPRPSAAPAADEEELRRQCNAYLAKPGPERGKALQGPALAKLVQVAGGADRVDGYCNALSESEKQKEKDKDKDKPSKAPPEQPEPPEPPRGGPGAPHSRPAE